MRIHTNNVTMSDINAAADKAGATVALTEHKSRTHAHAYEVKLTGLSNRRPNFWDGDESVYAATWDQWGVFLGFLYSHDHGISAGPYKDVNDFDRMTNTRFLLDYSQPIPFPLNHDHHFKYAGIPYENECTKCGAVKRWNI